MDAITVCNLALAKIGDQSIVSMTDGSLEARFCNLFYPVCVAEVLMQNTWNFATKMATLAKISTPPLFDWTYAYALPADYARITQFNSFAWNDPNADFEIKGTYLMTDEDSASICYISKTVDASLFTPSFVQVLACRLATELCRPLAGSTELKAQLLSEYNRLNAAAGAVDANDDRPRQIQPWVNSALVQSRYGGSSTF